MEYVRELSIRNKLGVSKPQYKQMRAELIKSDKLVRKKMMIGYVLLCFTLFGSKFLFDTILGRKNELITYGLVLAIMALLANLYYGFVISPILREKMKASSKENNE